MGSTSHRAGWVMVRPDVWVENGLVEVRDGLVVSVTAAKRDSRAVDHGPGVIMPALVNAHTHLSLSMLRGMIPTGHGFVKWVKDLIQVRSTFSEEKIAEQAAIAALEVKRSGTGIVAEVGPRQPGADAMIAAELEGTVFTEILGDSLELAPLPGDENGAHYSYAGHGLHTTSPTVMRTLKLAANGMGRQFSLHLAESEEETEFVAGNRGPWSDLLTSRGIDFSDWDIRNERPLARAERLGLLDRGTVAVHALQVNRDEIGALEGAGVKVCLCPRSNYALHGKSPDIEGFLKAGIAPALGTDSFASVSSLSMFDEMAFCAERYPGLSPETILGFATVNGAQALGDDFVGSLEVGMRARLIYVSLEANSKESAALQLVSGGSKSVEWL